MIVVVVNHCLKRHRFGNPRLLEQEVVFTCFSSRVLQEKYKLSSILMVLLDPSGSRTSQNSANHYWWFGADTKPSFGYDSNFCYLGKKDCGYE
jgi:hypothetical protein